MALLPNRRSIMTLYSNERDPASHAVRFVLAEKAVNVDVVHVLPDERPDDLIELNPYEDVLTLVDRDLVLYEPQIIMEYLDERFPHPPLMPIDPVTRAQSRLFRFRIQRDVYACVKQMYDPQKSVVDAARKALRDNLTAIAPIFSQTKFFMSDDYSLVDCFMAPVLWRLPSLGVKLSGQAKAMIRYGDNLFEREAFANSLTETEREMNED
ncbi:MAG: stringent starvation protein A [Gammaproteobacteria bacterium]|nr:stringent starvation protein A [Gammaproteobacteria bacterium]